MRNPGNKVLRVSVVWGLPSQLIDQIGSIPTYVQLDVISTAWALLRRLRGQPCDLLVIHWELPDSTGPALAARVRLLRSELPIVLTADGKDLPEPGVDLAALRVVGPLPIPIQWSHLLEGVLAKGVSRDAGALAESTKPAAVGGQRVLQQN